VARRRGARSARPLRRDEQAGARGVARVREFAMTRTLLLVLLALVAPGLPVAALSYGEVNTTLVDAVVVPAYERYAATTSRLPASIEALCASPDKVRLDAAQQAWREAMLAWQHAQPIGFGPITDQGLAPQIEFWPDKHGTAGRQFSQALADRDPALLEPDRLAGQSVGLTSLVSLERLLFGDEVLEPGGDYACAYALAIARHQACLGGRARESLERGKRLSQRGGRRGYRQRRLLLAPTIRRRRSIAASPTPWMARSRSSLSRPWATARMRRAAGGPRTGEARWSWPRSPPIWRPRALYATPGGFGNLYQAMGGEPAIDQQVRAGFETVLQTAQAIPLPLAEAVEDLAAREQVQQLVDQLKQLRELIRGPVVAALGQRQIEPHVPALVDAGDVMAGLGIDPAAHEQRTFRAARPAGAQRRSRDQHAAAEQQLPPIERTGPFWPLVPHQSPSVALKPMDRPSAATTGPRTSSSSCAS